MIIPNEVSFLTNVPSAAIPNTVKPVLCMELTKILELYQTFPFRLFVSYFLIHLFLCKIYIILVNFSYLPFLFVLSLTWFSCLLSFLCVFSCFFDHFLGLCFLEGLGLGGAKSLGIFWVFKRNILNTKRLFLCV